VCGELQTAGATRYRSEGRLKLGDEAAHIEEWIVHASTEITTGEPNVRANDRREGEGETKATQRELLYEPDVIVFCCFFVILDSCVVYGYSARGAWPASLWHRATEIIVRFAYKSVLSDWRMCVPRGIRLLLNHIPCRRDPCSTGSRSQPIS